MTGGLIVNNGKKIMLDRSWNPSPTRTAPTTFKVGTGTTAVVVTDTDLEHEIPVGATETVDDCEATTGWTDSADCTLSVNSSVYKVGSGSLNVTKDGTSGTDCSTYKTTTSIDFTSKELAIWIYIVDTTTLNLLAVSNCLTIRFGSDSSNYYYWQKDKADLAVGWNYIEGLTTATASTTGSPTVTACDYTYVGFTSVASGSTWSAGDLIMDDIKVISSDDYTATYEAGYPSIDYDILQVTVRTRVSSTKANGYAISEVGLFNTDGTPLMESRDTMTPVSKSSSDELIFVIKETLN